MHTSPKELISRHMHLSVPTSQTKTTQIVFWGSDACMCLPTEVVHIICNILLCTRNKGGVIVIMKRSSWKASAVKGCSISSYPAGRLCLERPVYTAFSSLPSNLRDFLGGSVWESESKLSLLQLPIFRWNKERSWRRLMVLLLQWP